MLPILEFLENYSGAFTFLVTFIYVIATCLILRANKISANAAQEQLEESKRQLDESKRQFEESKMLECLPFLQLEIPHEYVKPMFELELPLCKKDSSDLIAKTVKIKNVGNGTATNIVYTWKYNVNDILECDYPPINAIMKGDFYYIQFYCDIDCSVEDEAQADLILSYSDLLGNEYEQHIGVIFEQCDLVRFENDTPR